MPIELKIKCEKCGRPCKIVGELALDGKKVSSYIQNWYIGNEEVLCPECRVKYFAYQDRRNRNIYEDFINGKDV